MRRTITRCLALAGLLVAAACGGEKEGGSATPEAKSAAPMASTTTPASTAATSATATAQPSASATAEPTTTAAASASAAAEPTAHASAAAPPGTAATPAASGSAAAGPKTFDCGAKGQKPCPMQGWMKSVMASASSSGDGDKLAAALSYCASRVPPGMGNWASISNAGAAKAKAGDIDGAKQSCKQCHDAYKERYKTTMRDRPW